MRRMKIEGLLCDLDLNCHAFLETVTPREEKDPAQLAGNNVANNSFV